MKRTSDNYEIKSGYKARLNNEYYEDVTDAVTWQPDAYAAILELARRLGVGTIIDIGSGNGLKLIPFKEEFKFIFIDFGPNLKTIQKNIGSKGNKFINQDFEKGFPKIPKKTLENSIVICSDVIEHIAKPERLGEALAAMAKFVPFVLITTPDRKRTRGLMHLGPPQNVTHVREWSLEELHRQFRGWGMDTLLCGYTRSNDYEHQRNTIAILSGTYVNDMKASPDRQIKAIINTRSDHNSLHYERESIKPILYSQGKADIEIPKGTLLVSPHHELTTGSIISDALRKGYNAVQVQTILVKPNDTHHWPDAGALRHGLIGEMGKVEIQPLLKAKKRLQQKIYPIQLLFLKVDRRKNILRGPLSKAGRRLIDTGHLADDYFLESLVGFNEAG